MSADHFSWFRFVWQPLGKRILFLLISLSRGIFEFTRSQPLSTYLHNWKVWTISDSKIDGVLRAYVADRRRFSLIASFKYDLDCCGVLELQSPVEGRDSKTYASLHEALVDERLSSLRRALYPINRESNFGPPWRSTPRFPAVGHDPPV